MRKTTAGIVFLMILTLMCGAALAQTRVLATTFPVYQIVRNTCRMWRCSSCSPRRPDAPTITPSRRRT